MTISTTISRNEYVASSQVSFTYSFKIFGASDIAVYVNGTLQTITTNYTLSGVGSDSGGTVDFVIGSVPLAGASVIIFRSVASTRTSDYQVSGPFPALLINADLDRIWAKLQELQTNLSRAIALTPTDTNASLALPPVATRANSVLAFDQNGAVTAGGTLGAWRSDWVAGHAYVIRDLIRDTGAGNNTSSIYMCVVPHTSSTFAADILAGYWSLVIDVPSLATSFTGMVNVGGSNVGINALNGVIVSATATATIANGALPANVNLLGVSYAFASRFINGLAPGFNMTTAAGFKDTGTATAALYS